MTSAFKSLLPYPNEREGTILAQEVLDSAALTPDKKKDYAWIKGRRRTSLVALPLFENAPLIYEELGVYAGQPLGTPCDDL